MQTVALVHYISFDIKVIQMYKFDVIQAVVINLLFYINKQQQSLTLMEISKSSSCASEINILIFQKRVDYNVNAIIATIIYFTT